MKVTALAFAFSLLSSVAFAAEGGMDGQPRGDNGGGYGRNNPRGVEGGAFGSGPTRGSGQCNRCSEIDYDNPRSITREDPSWSGRVGVSERGFGVDVGFNSEKRSTTYGRTERGIDADGGACSCSRGGGFGDR